MAIMKLATLQVLINGNLVKSEYLDLLFDSSEKTYCDKDKHYIFEKVEKLTDDIYWVYAKIGCTTPYSHEVIDTETYESMQNPRDIKLIEPNTQLFCFYDNRTKLLFINNLKFKSQIEGFFQRKLDSLDKRCTVSVCNVFSDPEKFAETLSVVKQIGFKYREDLFNTEKLGAFDMFPQPKSLLGLEVNQNVDYELNIKFDEARVTKMFLEKFKKLVGMRKTGDFKGLICVGKDKNNLDTIFRLDNITKKLDIKVSEDKETKLFDSEEVKSVFLRRLERTDDL